MTDKDRGSDKTRRKGAKPEQRETKATKPAAPKQPTKPATKINSDRDQTPPR